MSDTYYKDVLKCFMQKNANESELWNQFLALYYDNGHLQVPNTDPKTVGEYPTVTMLYLMQKDRVYRDDILNKYDLWLEANRKPVDLNKITTASPTKIKFIPFNNLEKEIKEEYEDVYETEIPENLLKKFKTDIPIKTNDYINKHGLNDTKKISEALGISILEKNKISKNREVVVKPFFDFIDEEPKISSVKFDLEDRDVKFSVRHYADAPNSISLSHIYLNSNLHQKNIGLKLTTNLLGYAEKNNLDRIDLLAYRDDEDLYGTSPYIGYKVWPRLGFNGDLKDADGYINKQNSTKYNHDPIKVIVNFLEFIENNGDSKLQKLYQDLKNSPIDAEYNTQFTIQNLYSLGPEAIQIWEQIGGSVSLSLATNINTRSNQVFKKYLQKKIDKNLQSLTEWYNE